MNEPILVTDKAPERAFLIGVVKKGETRHQVGDTLSELALLADTAGAVVVDKIVQERAAPDSATFIGKGLAESLADRVRDEKIELVMFDDDLSPAQAKNLELLWENVRVIDRTGLILDIFAKRARTRESIVQVEVAQLEYLLPRLSGRWAHLERQRGGIGLRGPGETQLETDRRLIRERIAHLKRMLQFIEVQTQTKRRNRESSFRIALVGYTNAGKSTLLKALCGGDPFIENRLFATLDPLVRPLRLPNSTEPALLTDTVGFIRKLPHSLVASFHSTLSEASEADLLLHVADATHPNVENQMAEVAKVLEEIGADKVPQLVLFNKIDELDDTARLRELQRNNPEAVFISALRGHRLWELKNAIAERRALDWSGSEAMLSPEGAGEGLAAIYRMGEVITQEVKDDGTIKVKYRVPVRNQRTLEELLSPLLWKPEAKKRALPEGLKESLAMLQDSEEEMQSDSRYPAKSNRERPRHSRPIKEERSQQEIDLANEDPPRNRSGQIIQPEREDRDSRPPRRDYSDRPPRRDFGDRPPPRRFDRDDRPPRREFGDRPPPRRFDRDGERPPNRGFGDRPPPRRFDRDDRPPRRDSGDRPPRRDSGDRPPRRDFGDRPPPRRFDRDDRPPRRDSGDRPPRRDFGDRPPPRRFDHDDRPPRRDSGDRPPRRDFGDRPPPRRFDRDDRPPRRDSGDRPPRRDFGDRPPPRRFDRDDRPPRRDDGDRPPRRDYGDRPDRPHTPRSADSSRPSRSRDDRPSGGSRYGSKPKSGGYGGGSRKPRG